MRIRKSFATSFLLLTLFAAYVGLTTQNFDAYIPDKVLHALVFFFLTLIFYWILDTHRRRAINFTLAVCTGGLSVGSEILQEILPNGRNFDLYDIICNVFGSLTALGINSWYHGRMLERRRRQRGRRYEVVPGEDIEDVELGLQETGVVDVGEGSSSRELRPVVAPKTLEEEVDNWDENALDNWSDGEEEDMGVRKSTEETKTRTD